MKKQFTFETGGFLTQNDKKAIIESLSNSKMRDNEKRTIEHRKTQLRIVKYSVHMYSVSKSVNNGKNYLYNSYFHENL
jgi:hypothetical protein